MVLILRNLLDLYANETVMSISNCLFLALIMVLFPQIIIFIQDSNTLYIFLFLSFNNVVGLGIKTVTIGL